jgi:hypothetical protein
MKLKTKEISINANIPVIEFKEENVYYYYTPALDVYGYGYTKKEAEASFEICIEEFFKYTIENGTLHEVLTTDLGWKIKTKDELPVVTVPDIFKATKRSQDVYKS